MSAVTFLDDGVVIGPTRKKWHLAACFIALITLAFCAWVLVATPLFIIAKG